MKKVGCIILVVSCITACSSYYSSNGDDKYLQSRNGPNLVVPAPLTSYNLSHFYDLPSQTQNAKVSIVPSKVSS